MRHSAVMDPLLRKTSVKIHLFIKMMTNRQLSKKVKAIFFFFMIKLSIFIVAAQPLFVHHYERGTFILNRISLKGRH